MQLAIVTLFPGMFGALTEYGITGRAHRQGLIQLSYFNPRDYTTDRHRTVDDKPYGGGPGMLMMSGPLDAAINAARRKLDTAGGETSEKAEVIYLSPQGKPLQQADVQALAGRKLVLLCGRYEGIDERIIASQVDREYSLGDFVLSGGELAAMTLVDAMTRLLPGALGAADSAEQDSFSEGLLDHPHYTRPEVFADQRVPAVLLSGDHARIARWRLQQRLGNTWRKRPDLLAGLQLSKEEQQLLDEYIQAWQAQDKAGQEQ